MRRMMAASFLATCGMLAVLPARADWIGPFKGNDTGGIIAYSAATETDARQAAVAHCASYGKVARFLSIDAQYGGYISFACRWVPYGSAEQPLVTRY